MDIVVDLLLDEFVQRDEMVLPFRHDFPEPHFLELVARAPSVTVRLFPYFLVKYEPLDEGVYLKQEDLVYFREHCEVHLVQLHLAYAHDVLFQTLVQDEELSGVNHAEGQHDREELVVLAQGHLVELDLIIMLFIISNTPYPEKEVVLENAVDPLVLDLLLVFLELQEIDVLFKLFVVLCVQDTYVELDVTDVGVMDAGLV